MSIRAKLLSFIAAAALILAAYFLLPGSAPTLSEEAEAVLGFTLPKGVVVVLINRKPGFGSELVYIKLKMDRDSWDLMCRNRPFVDIDKTFTGNPFLKTVNSFGDAEPQRESEGVGGMVKVDSRRVIQYFFTFPRGDVVNGYLLVGLG